MKTLHTALAALALAVQAGTPAVAGPEAAPITLTACRFFVYTPDAFNGDRQSSRLRTLWVTFRNTGDAPVTAVTFSAVEHGEHLIVTDVGRFSKGATVTHQLEGYSTGSLELGPGKDTCKVLATRY